MMKKRKDFSSKSGVKFRIISNHVITFSVGGFGFTSGIICCVKLFQQAYDLFSHLKF